MVGNGLTRDTGGFQKPVALEIQQARRKSETSTGLAPMPAIIPYFEGDKVKPAHASTSHSNKQVHATAGGTTGDEIGEGGSKAVPHVGLPKWPHVRMQIVFNMLHGCKHVCKNTNANVCDTICYEYMDAHRVRWTPKGCNPYQVNMLRVNTICKHVQVKANMIP